jgi:aryl-alcohol dehydrogenase-like predicted oxidoreductase
MDKVTLGRSGLKVSPICFGTWAFGGEWGPVDTKSATATIHRARDLGVNFFDTAQAYGFGASEQLLGAAFARELRAAREDVVIATKGGLRREGDRLVRDASREWLRQGVDASLRALRVDVIDLYQLHWPDPSTHSKRRQRRSRSRARSLAANLGRGVDARASGGGRRCRRRHESRSSRPPGPRRSSSTVERRAALRAFR